MAQASGKPLGQILSQLARRGLRAQADVSMKNGLPLFNVSPDARIIPGNRAADLLADDAT